MTSAFSQEAAGNIAAMASKIQDSIQRLEAEKAVLELLQAEQAEKQALLKEAQRDCAETRIEYLEAMRANHGLELEVWKVRQKKQECIEAMDKLHRETKELREYKQELLSQWEELVNECLAGHQVHREIYTQTVEASIGKQEELVQTRKRQLESLESRTEALRIDEQSLEEEKKRIQKELEDFERAEQDDDEAIDKLAEEVKAMIAKRSCLRKNLREHKKAFEKANANTLKWERECIELAEAGDP